MTISLQIKNPLDRYAVMGNPIQHSWSPQIHTLFAKQTQQSLVYSSILVPLKDFHRELNAFRASGGRGLNITLPFKQQAYQAVDSLSERARRANAVNTIQFLADGSLFGDNTDGVGFVRDIANQHMFSLLKKHILVLGAGGAVRGILDPILKESPESLIIANRTKESAELLAADFSHYPSVKACSLTELAEFKEIKFDLIINGTSASLTNDNLDLSGDIIGRNTFCYDMVYGKEVTPFMHWAKINNAACVTDGLGMLIEQAAEAFYIWRGVRPDIQSVLNYFKSQR